MARFDNSANAPLRGNNTWAKIWSEATEPTCYCPRELATDYSGLLCADAQGFTELMLAHDGQPT